MRSSSPVELTRCQPWLGTFVRIRASGATEDARSRGVARAFRAVAMVHDIMSVHDPSSEVSALNREAISGPVRVSADTCAVLRLAQTLHSASGGAFDIAVAPALMRAGFLPRQGDPHAVGTTADIVVRDDRCVTFEKPLQIDLGGIAKGYAVDVAVAALQDSGVPAGAVDAGGDLRVFGPSIERVHVRHPRSPGELIPLAEIREMAVATSANYFAVRRWCGRMVTPIVEPLTAQPCLKRCSVSVVAPTCALADALAKVVFIRGAASFAMLEQFGASAAIIEPSGRIRRTKGIDAA